MRNKKLRRLQEARSVMLVLAAVLFCMTTISGVLHFTGSPRPAKQAPPVETTAPA